MPVSDTPIYHEMLLERAIKDPEGVALVEGIHERLRATADPHGVIAQAERIRAKREALAARPASPGPEVRATQAVIRATKAGLLGLGAAEEFAKRWVHEVVERRNAALERACERAVQSGQYGVLVLKSPDGVERIGVSALVPYGHMVEVPEEGLDAWIANGCPVT